MQFNLDYFYGNETGQFRFYRVPKALFGGALSLEAVTLYGMMLDRVGLSAKNGWMDGLGRVFIYFVQKDVQKFLRCGHNRATAFMRELERFGLIKRKRQGLGKPAMIYVKNFSGCGNDVALQNETNEAVKPPRNEEKVSAVQREKSSNKALFSAPAEAVWSAQTRPSGVPAEGSLDCPNRAANETEKKETELTETNRILPQPPRSSGSCPRYSWNLMDEMRWVREEIQENIDYKGLIWDHPCDAGIFDGYVELMVEACCSTRENVRICGQELPAAVVRSRFLKLEREHVEYVRDCLCHATTAIGNVKAYTLAALYNAPATMSQYYTALVNHDMLQTGF
nr:DUF6017 domain-containing protein [uncultured Oscillibacter sp.]